MCKTRHMAKAPRDKKNGAATPVKSTAGSEN